MKTALILAAGLAATATAAEYEYIATNGMNLARSATHDGRSVAITTWASLSAQDTNLLADVYVADRNAQTFTLASAGTNGFTSYGSVGSALISSNGTSVLYDLGNVYLRRLPENSRETVNATGTPTFFTMSRDGRYAFYTLTGTQALNRRDNDAGTNRVITSIGGSVGISGDGERAAFAQTSSRTVVLDFANATTNTIGPNPILSADGQIVISLPAGFNPVIQDLATGSSNRYPYQITSVSLSADGGTIAGEARGLLGAAPFAQVVLIDKSTGATNLISATAGTTQPANGWSGAPVVSRDGRFVAFESWATDLTANDTNNTKDVFLYDVRAKTLARINTGSGPSFNPFFSDDSRTLFFHNGKTDGDVDIIAMTLETLSIQGISIEAGGTRRLIWTSLPETRYQLEFKNSI
ncbi:MAG TPA: hypothetical protein VM680_14025, partial [Verrucomicrobiae bacterium]|nr:hypothetical protein [Verrucomicrobiae bacterium]